MEEAFVKISLLNNAYKNAAILFTNQYSNKVRTLQEWEWEFESYDSNSQIYVFGEKNGDVIGTQALLPISIIINNMTILSAKSEETLVHPKFRGKNVFDNMYDLAFTEANLNKIQLIWGFTDAKKPFSKVGFHVFDKGLNTFIFVLSVFKAVKQINIKKNEHKLKAILKRIFFLIVFFINKYANLTRYKPSIRRINYDIKIIDEFNEETDKLCQEISECFPELVTVDRNKVYMKWRITDNPHYLHKILGLYHKGDLVGYAVLARADESLELIMVDLIIRPDHIKYGATILLQNIKKFAKEKELGYISFKFMPCSNIYATQIFKKIKTTGFFKSIGVLPFILKSLDDSINEKVINYNKWYITGIMTEGIVHKEKANKEN